MLHNQRGTVSALLLALVAMLILSGTQLVSAQGCSISSFTQDPSKPSQGYSLGTNVILNGRSDCGTVKFQITRYSDGAVWDKAEIGAPNQTETWKTNETGTGDFELCFMGHSSGGWQSAARSCVTVYVQGNQGAPIGSTVTGNCWINNGIVVTPSSGPLGTVFNMSGTGQCDGNMRAARFTIQGYAWGEGSVANLSSTWTSDFTGSISMCYQITSGDWANKAESCTSIQVNNGGTTSTTTSQGAPATNYDGVPPSSGQDSSDGTTNSGEANNNPQTSNQPIVPVQPTSCNPVVPTRLSIGAIGLVSDFDPNPVPLRSSPERNASILVQVPVREALTMIGNAHCDGEGLIWYETQYGGQTGWIAETTRKGMYNLVPNGMAMPGDSRGTTTSGSSSNGIPVIEARDFNTETTTNTSSTSCNGALPPTMGTGDHGRVTYTDGSATAMRSRPQGDKVRDLPEGTEFDVTGEPVCTAAQQGKLWWVPISTSDRLSSGWVPFGYSSGPYWIEKWENNSMAADSSTLQAIRVVVTTVDGYSYPLILDRGTTPCRILNGAEVVALEIDYFSSRYRLAVIKTAMIINYFAPDAGVGKGEVESIRQFIIARLQEYAPECTNFVYVVGNRTMDTSGVGNIVFGYYAGEVGMNFEDEDAISNMEQGVNIRSLLRFYDNDDDFSQRFVGRRISQNTSSTPTADDVVKAAEALNLR